MLLAVPVMVGLFPVGSPSPLGRVLGRAFDSVPFAGAFRTTNKIGALLVLGTALLVAAGTAWLWRRWPDVRVRAATAVGLAVVLVAGTAPAWTGDLYISAVDVPKYWRAAAADLTPTGATSGCGSCRGRCRRRTGGPRTGRTTSPRRCWTARRWSARSSR